MSKWTQTDAPNLEGQVYVVTGANSGIGFEVARMLCAKKATVIMACRNLERGNAARARIERRVDGADVAVERLDLADLESVKAFAATVEQRHPKLHGLLNNAGLMAIPRQTTEQGFEMQLGVNHLGHFALTARLLAPLVASGRGRIVNVSSEAHRAGRMRFDDLMGERRYSRWGAYTQSKLANLLFTRRLQVRLSELNVDVSAFACHPGYAATELQGRSDNVLEDFFFKRIANRVVAQSAAMGALPTLRAAVDPSVRPGAYVGPTSMFGARGYPEIMTPSRAAHDDDHAEQLWMVSQQLTGETIG